MTNDFRPIASSPWGQLMFLSDRDMILLVNYSKNSVEKLQEPLASQISKLIASNSILHFADSSLVIQSGNNWMRGLFSQGDTIKLSSKNFTETGISIYEPTRKVVAALTARKTEDYQLLLIGSMIGAIVSGLGVYLIFFRKNHLATADAKGKFTLSIEGLFDDKEKELINLIKNNSINGRGTAIDDVNRLLGVGSKNSEIQKKQRSDALISINEKWKRFSKTQHILIDKKRLEQDKRSYEYFIDQDQIDMLKHS